MLVSIVANRPMPLMGQNHKHSLSVSESQKSGHLRWVICSGLMRLQLRCYLGSGWSQACVVVGNIHFFADAKLLATCIFKVSLDPSFQGRL